jgi:hypothetical protein
VNIATQPGDGTVSFRAKYRARGAAIYTLNLPDAASHASAASDLTRRVR